MTKTTLFAAVMAMASTSSAHMFIANPVPLAQTFPARLALVAAMSSHP